MAFSRVSCGRISCCVGLLFAVLMASLPAQAQTLGAAAGTANPGRVQQQIPQAVPDVMENTPVQVEGKQAVHAPAGAENIRFELHAVDIEGITAYDRARIDRIYASHLGQKVTLAYVYQIAAEVTRLYRDDGYVLTQVVIPPQRIADGRVRLRVVEGYIDHVTLKGALDSERPLILSYARRLVDQTPLNIRDLERALLLINDLPGVTARSILSPSQDSAGGAELTILIARKPYDVEVDANNYGTKFLGPYQLGASAALNSPLDNNERITAQTVYAPGAHMTPELMYYAAGYYQPIGDDGTTVEFNGSYTNTSPGDSLRPFDVTGNAVFGSLTVAHPFIRSRNTNLAGRFLFDVRDVDTNDNIETTRKDRIRALRIGARYDTIDTLLGTAGFNTADLLLSQGIGLFDATGSHDDNTSRSGASDTFTKLEGEIQRIQHLAPSFALLVAGEGQVSRSKLSTTEQFGVGGLDYGRGYDPSEIIGDNGVAGKTELQWADPVRVRYVDHWQAFGFYDIGAAWTKDPISAADRKDSVASTGLGLRAFFESGTSLNAILAFPLTRDVQTKGDKGPRVFVGLSQRF